MHGRLTWGMSCAPFCLLWVYFKSTLSGLKRRLEMQHTINEAASKFTDNQPCNSGNLTCLDWHITLMNGKDLTKQYRIGKLQLLFWLLEPRWSNLWVQFCLDMLVFSIYIWFLELWFHLHNRTSKWWKQNGGLSVNFYRLVLKEEKANTTLRVSMCLFFLSLAVTQCRHTCTQFDGKIGRKSLDLWLLSAPLTNRERQ